MIRRRIMEVIVVCLIGTLAAGAQAQQEKWKTVRFPASGGYVVSYDRPIDWYHDGNNTASHLAKMDRINKRINFTPGSKYHAGEVDFIVSRIDLPRPATLERLIKEEKARWKDYAMIVHGEGTMQVMGKKAFYYLSSGKTTWKGGKKVPATGPTKKTMIVVLNDRVYLVIIVRATYTEQFKALQPTFDRMLKSLKVTPIAKLDASLIAHVYSTPDTRISRRRGYFLDVSISMTLPPGWAAGDPTVRHATVAKPRGRMIVEIRRKKDPDGPSFLIVVEGMPPNRPLEPADYLATTDRLIGKLMTKYGPGKTIKVASSPRFFCLGHRKNRIWTGTGKRAHVRSYSGKDEKGRDVRARVYTAGGYSAACNLIFIAQTKDFDKTLPDIEAIVKSIASAEYSPSLSVR